MIKVTTELMKDISAKAKSSARKRTNYNFHKNLSDPIQRMLNAAEPGTYIQPHKHESPDKIEVFIILSGRAVMVEYDSAGNIADHIILDAKDGAKAVEIPPRHWHSFITLKPGTVLYEVKEGPYDEKADKHFASWAPSESLKEKALEFNKSVLVKLKIEER
ncbi:MAG: WbuC family cupin fold metalloprotein [Candidatus Omnitrophica bacterium]|nr:WbuC family cupin fold metalloprotein [Candidatus Omnitrophota bacterium]